MAQCTSLHARVKDELPPAFPSVVAAYREIAPTLLRQARDADYYVQRALPGAATAAE